MLLREYSDSPVSVMIVTSCDSDRQALKAVMSGTRWSVHETGSIASALQLIATSNVGVVLSDCDLVDGIWVNLLEGLRSRRNAPRLIVYSRTADTKFWADVLSLGGYDVLATPFNREEVLRAVYTGWLSWTRASRATPTGARQGGVFGPPAPLSRVAKIG